MRSHVSILPGLILVIIGVIMLLDQAGIYFFHWSFIFSLLAVMLGLYMWVRALRSKEKRGVFTGTLLIVFGGFFLLWNYSPFYYHFYFRGYAPIFPIAIGLAFFALFVVDFRKWWALFPAAFFLSIGGIGLASTLHYINHYILQNMIYRSRDIIHVIAAYFPMILVGIGLLLIIGSMRKVRKPRYEVQSTNGE